MKRDVLVLILKFFKFKKIEESDFHLDVRKNGQSQRLKISNLNLICLCM